MRSASSLLGGGRELSNRTVIDRGPDGTLRVSSRQDGTRTEVVLTPSGRVAVPVTRLLGRALTKHGMKRLPPYVQPRRSAVDGRASYRTYDQLSDPGRLSAELNESLVGLTSTSVGTRTMYTLTLSDQVSTVTATVVTVDGLLTSVTVGEQATLRYTYGATTVTFPKHRPSGLKRRVAEREYTLYSMAGSMGVLISILHPKATTRAKRVRLLQRMFAKTADGTGPRITVRDLRRGVEISSTVRGWRHPLTWRIVATRHGVQGSPIGTT